MAAKKSAKYPYRWSNGTYHSRPQHGAAKSNVRTVTLKDAPPGTYDAGLDYQERAARRGLQDLIGPEGDLTRQGLYADEDFAIGNQDIGRQRRELGEDYATGQQTIERGHGRTMADLLTQEQGVNLSYRRLANRQAQTGRAAGLEGGYAQQAAGKRAGNEALDIAPINVARGRAAEDRQLSLNDLLQDYTRGGEALDRGVGALTRPYQRDVTSRDIQGRRGQRELGEFGRELDRTRMEQYLQGGGKRQIKLNLRKPAQRKQYQRFRRLGVI